ncbi:DNA polymerase III subunit alpha [Ottowia sp. GY511]|uniref:Error-prone DNA polymerase n=1 Tax=Ottowia flava TaxID=2675430 RepID=A0ABW4KZV2_9BURK|nr:error-prone DNA polymerase [Ottowia sp. GY511]TXK23422.1 DNA polymerase III subunit alpha [Ottowia sp. GY511]
MKPEALTDYAELRCRSNFSFLTGASRPEELVERAHALGYRALALTDECSVAGAVRAHQEAKARGLHLIIGAQFLVDDELPWTLVLLATNRAGYANLCTFITKLRRSSPKGTYTLRRDAINGSVLTGLLAIACPDREMCQAPPLSFVAWLAAHFPKRCWIGVEALSEIDDQAWLHALRGLSARTGVALVAVGNVQFHVRSRKPLHDVLTAVRLNCTLASCGSRLLGNAEAHLRTRVHLARIFPEDLLKESVEVARRCTYSLDEIRYEYPAEVVPHGMTASAFLRQLTYEGCGRRWPHGVPARISQQIEHELCLIEELRYEHYFLTVHDIVAFARSNGILCQGRGSAANSVVCYCLHVTEVDPSRMSVLFERFISKERNEPPDIDIDFEHERREEVIQYLYQKYGRHRAALTATVVTYRPKSALRDVGKALGYPGELIDRLCANHSWWDGVSIIPERIAGAGLDLDDPRTHQLMELTDALLGFPRHLSQHTGGFVLTKGPLEQLVPIENASMPDRTVIQWDKDDIDALGLLKVDVLALGMLTAIRKSLALIGERLGYAFSMQDVPAEDETTYDMVCAADTIGVFQVESRAQQQMLPRLKPRCFYDLVIEVAIVRPGPIQGRMVHPYLNRRMGREPVMFPSEALREALGRTLGVPVFQEQVMQVAILAAGFTPGEADQLRRSMAAWKRKGGLQHYYDKIVYGMVNRGYSREFADSIFDQIKGFSEYGFPESHAASFALLVYVSCWIKCHYPGEFLCAMLNSQPLGFYTPSQLVQDAQRHNVVVLPPDVMHSAPDCTMDDPANAGQTVRLGLRMIRGLKARAMAAIAEARRQAPFGDVEDLARRADLDPVDVRTLAAADALRSLSGHRRVQVWDASAYQRPSPLMRDAAFDEPLIELQPAAEGEEIVWDYATQGLTLRRHPLALLRPLLARRQLLSSNDLSSRPDGAWVRFAGLVTLRQAPETAKGTMFVSLEDEFGTVQVILSRQVRDQFRDPILKSRFMAVEGRWQHEGPSRNLIGRRAGDLSPLLGRLNPTRQMRTPHQPSMVRRGLIGAIGANAREG